MRQQSSLFVQNDITANGDKTTEKNCTIRRSISFSILTTPSWICFALFGINVGSFENIKLTNRRKKHNYLIYVISFIIVKLVEN